MKFVKEKRGQAGDVFRLMVDAIIGLVILVIILTTIAYFETLRVQVSIAEMKNIIKGAVETPSGKLLESNTLSFSGGEGYTGPLFEEWTGVPAKCFEFESNLGSIKIVEGPGGGAIFQTPLETKVYAYCLLVPGSDVIYGEGDDIECELECLISFGRKPVVNTGAS